MKSLIFFLTFLALIGCYADEPKLDYQALGTGIGLLAAPIPLADGQLSWGHAIELEGFSFAATDIGKRILPKDLDFVAPVAVGVLDLMYRAGEGLESPTIQKKLVCDWLGVLGRVSLDIKF